MPFAKGLSGNPGGKPKRAKLFEKELLAALKVADKDGEKLQKVAKALVEKAIGGDVAAIREIADRLDGKPARESAVTIEDKRVATDWTRDELVAFLREAGARSNGVPSENAAPLSRISRVRGHG